MPNAETRYTVYPIPPVPGQHHIVQYKDLRLQAIQTDRHHFTSSYEREASLTYEQWKARLQSREKTTIVAAASFQSSERLSWQHKWVGMVTVIGPKILKKFGFKPPRSVTGCGVCYCFVGVWVDPSHRGKGLGKEMILSGLDWIRADDVSDSGVEKRTLLLQVTQGNHPAIGLYSAMGFRLLEAEDGLEENLWMSMELGVKPV
ncbi:hypothetical protein NP233_g1968 [Leucocoprinus birnbaumii]|uniref:N-acetyltransferase domain-containing protein n=1 Tax=Leucocoprinus birnbaumii TaxID=56174 RepID=A0AAD5YXK3_9AGAR|nr:hypothetical protein NP233_g1968 [Leucocoprinus birnbaumii]